MFDIKAVEMNGEQILRFNKLVYFCFVTTVLYGCYPTVPKDEVICIDIVKELIPDPQSLVLNRISRFNTEATLNELEQLYASRDKGSLSVASKSALSVYERNKVKFTKIIIKLDVTFNGSLGKTREDAFCEYLNYSDITELVSLSLGNTYVERANFFNFFLSYGRPDGLDIFYRVK